MISNKISVEVRGRNRISKFLKLELLVPSLLLGCGIIMGTIVPSLVTTSIINRDVPFPPYAILGIGFAIVAFTSVCWIWDELRRVLYQRSEHNSEERGGWGRIWVAFGILMAGYLSVKYIGMVTAGAFIHAALLRLFGGKKIIYIIVTSILYSAAVFLIFEGLFNVRLPRSVIMPFLPF